MIDVEDNVYDEIKIGNQVWTVENLRTTKYNDGTPIPHVTDDEQWEYLTTPAYCYYYNDSVNKAKYGALYNWYAVNTGKLAPKGWRVPTDDDWTKLKEYLIVNGYNWDGTTTGNKIGKALAATTDWVINSTPGCVGNDLSSNNGSRFSVLPGGYRNHGGTFGNQSYYGRWWSATEIAATGAFNRNLHYNNESLIRSGYLKSWGFSVRLIKDYKLELYTKLSLCFTKKRNGLLY